MTIEELIDRYRPQLADETVGVRRSWEETFRYALRFYPGNTPVQEFDPDVLAERMSAAGIQAQFVEGYASRWRGLIDRLHKT